MKKLLPSETDLVGKWLVEKGKVVSDETCQRINELVTNYLEKIAVSEDGWDVLYKDPEDGRYWELVYYESQLHGGGPPRLTWLSLEQAKEKYGVVLSDRPQPGPA